MRIARSRAAAVALAVTATATGLAATAAPATASTGNPYSAQADGHAYRHGAVLTQHEHELATGWESQHASPNGRTATSAKTLSYGGGVDGIGVTSGHEKVYLVFWGTQWGTQSTNSAGNYTFSNDTLGGSARIESMFKGLGTGGESWSGTMTQYCDGSLVAKGATSCSSSAAHVAYPTGGAFAGVWYDNSAAEPTAATGAQLGAEAVKAAGHFGNTTAASNRYAQYIVLSPKGLNPDSYKTGGFCAWHDWNGDVGASSSYGDIAFTNMPYVMDQGTSCGQNFVNSGSAGTLDGYTIVSGHEYAETITDQNPAGGWTNTGSGTYGGEENADECAWISPGSAGGAANVSMSTGSFPMQSTWSNDTSSCAISHATVS